MESEKESEDKEYTHIPFDIAETGINLDLIISKHKDLSTEVICSICLAMVYDPIMCSKCENLFCRSCISALLKKSFKCPNKCIFEEKQIGRVLKNLLNKFELQCYFSKNGCSSILLYGDFVKHCNSCDYSDFKCSTENCGFVGIRKDTISHVKVCPLKLILCRYCKEKIYQKDFEDHTRVCESKLVNCKYCKAQMKNIALEKHIDSECDMIEIECNRCYSKFIKKNYEKHDNEDCLSHQVDWWKQKAGFYANEIEKLKKELIEAEKKNQRYINISTKLLENPSNSINSIRNNLELNAELGIAEDNQYPALFSRLSNHNLPENFFMSVLSNKYKTEVISTKGTLSGLVYSMIDLSPFSAGLICCGNFNSIYFFQVPLLENKFVLEGHTSYIWSLAHLKSYNLRFIASGSQDLTIKVWDISLKQCQLTLSGHESWVVSLSLLELDSKYLMSASHDNTLRIWDISSLLGTNTKTISNVYGKMCGNASSFNPALIVYGNNSNSVVLYDYVKNSVTMELKGHTDLVNHFADLGAFQRNYIGTGSDDTTIKIWNLLTGNMVTSFHGHSKCINLLVHLSNFEDNSIIASGSDDKTLRLWSLSSSQCLSMFVFESWVKSMLHLKHQSSKDNVIVHGQTNMIKLLKISKY